VDGFAVVAHFGTRDPVDEIAARNLIAEITDRPVTCGHELASALNGPKRALTAVLNARLIGMIARLISATEETLAKRGIKAPLMLVRGDGSLVSAEFARARPIETILSGPAASLVGAAHLTRAMDAVVSDIGGTTTDIAILQDGSPALSPEGATVGGHSTMVEAVAMTTHGLGGDSEVHVDDTGLNATLRLGPRRVLPVSLLATDHPDLVHGALDTQLARPLARPLDGRFIVPVNTTGHVTDPKEQALLDQIGDSPKTAEDILRARTDYAVLRRLVSRGVLQVAAFTPSDAAHVLGDHSAWDTDAAQKTARLIARKRDGAGRAIAPDADTLGRMVRESLVRRSAELLLDAALAHDGIPGADHALGALATAALSGHHGASRISLGLDMPLIGLGASAPLYYPAIAATLGTAPLIPADADVANAVGAVVGMVRLSTTATITTPAEGLFRVHDGTRTADHTDLDQARDAAFEVLEQLISDDAQAAGATEIRLTRDWQEKTATIEGKPVFIEGTASVVASGRPRIA
jgi:N-methylhydantoinase A/oxoprolinase/acetone carboxylase beta subunit